MADLLHFVRRLAAGQGARDRFRSDPDGVLRADVDDASDVTGEDVEAAVEWVRRSVAGEHADRFRITGTVRPLGSETPREAAVRVLHDLCIELDGPPAEVVTLPHRERVDAPPPATVAQGGGDPVPREPPGGRWLHPVIPDDQP